MTWGSRQQYIQSQFEYLLQLDSLFPQNNGLSQRLWIFTCWHHWKNSLELNFSFWLWQVQRSTNESWKWRLKALISQQEAGDFWRKRRLIPESSKSISCEESSISLVSWIEASAWQVRAVPQSENPSRLLSCSFDIPLTSPKALKSAREKHYKCLIRTW